MAEPAAVSKEDAFPRPKRPHAVSSSTAMSGTGRPEAAAAIWDWRRSQSRQRSGEERKRARIRGAVQAVVGLALGTVIFLFWSRGLAGVVWAIAGLTLAAALFSPDRAYARITWLIGFVATGIGVGMSWLLLTPLYYLFFAPFGLLFRRGAADRLERRFDRSAPTYWKRRAVESPSPADYERQF